MEETPPLSKQQLSLFNEVDEKFFNREENEKYKEEVDELNDLHLSIYSERYQEKRKELNQKYAKNINKYEKALKDGKNELLKKIFVYISC